MKSTILVLGTIIAMSLTQAATLRSEDEALAAFKAIWKDTLADKLASSSHIVQLRLQVFEEGRVTAQELQSAACQQVVTSSLSADERKQLILFGTLDDLVPDRKVWAIANPGHYGNGFEAYLDQKTGKLLFLWIRPEG